MKMADDADADEPTELAVARTDYVASAAKSILGAAPFAGSLLAEIAGTIIPNQRIDRIAKFAVALERRLKALEETAVRAEVQNEQFTELVEEALRQASRSTSDDRREYIASLVTTSLSGEHIAHEESKHLLRMLGELNDVEVLWLRFYLVPTLGGDQEFRTRHSAVLEPLSPAFGSPKNVFDKAALQDSYKEHLAQLGLLERRYARDSRTKELKVDRRTGAPEVAGYELTPLGRLLLRHVGLASEHEAG
jgi:hypothetical protein